MLSGVLIGNSPSFIVDTTSETKIEVAMEEKKSGNDFIVNTPSIDVKTPKSNTGFYFSLPRIDNPYLNNIFKPPIFL